MKVNFRVFYTEVEGEYKGQSMCKDFVDYSEVVAFTMVLTAGNYNNIKWITLN